MGCINAQALWNLNIEDILKEYSREALWERSLLQSLGCSITRFSSFKFSYFFSNRKRLFIVLSLSVSFYMWYILDAGRMMILLNSSRHTIIVKYTHDWLTITISQVASDYFPPPSLLTIPNAMLELKPLDTFLSTNLSFKPIFLWTGTRTPNLGT